jgi:hypothetical protein
LCLTVLVAAVLSLLTVLGIPFLVTQWNELMLPAGAGKLLRVVEDSDLPVRERAMAVSQLRKLPHHPSIIDRLLLIVSDDSDTLNLAIIETLGDYGDRKAIPRLEELRDSPVLKTGKIYRAIDDAIMECTTRNRRP